MQEYTLGDMVFSWSEEKATSNAQKHGVSFEEAATAFRDADAQLYDDKDHSEEERFILIGYSAMSRILLVCHCYREDGGIIRIISARKASRSERRLYEERS